MFQREGKQEHKEEGSRDPSWFTCTSLRAAGLRRAWALAGLFATDQVGLSLLRCDGQPGAHPASDLLGTLSYRSWEVCKEAGGFQI